jgi:hypothetical protein
MSLLFPSPAPEALFGKRARAAFRESRSKNGIGVPAAGSLLFYFCPQIARVILLVFVLVSAAIDDKSGPKFKWLWL